MVLLESEENKKIKTTPKPNCLLCALAACEKSLNTPPPNLNLAIAWQRHTQCLFPMPDNKRVKTKQKN